MSSLDPRKAAFAVLCLVSAAAGVSVACTGDDFALPSNEGDGGTPAAEAGVPATCATLDTTPCGCGAGKGCCIGNGVVKCVPSGTGSPADGCESTTSLDCVGTTCGGGDVCCYNGDVSTGSVCAKRLTAFDTRCAPKDTTGGPQCKYTSNGIVHELTCVTNDDCTKYDAGTCVAAVMDTVNRVMGICVR